ncbi:FxSxx-COOH system tetratricopeptide repeat protein [Actinomadura sp. 21ATH]|uniref:FxSxx-COOH system tetratricopeptide repeat protein n=1 Tax=Actinomadura sp. 21ATH TaxID=1735444 RepID=UPI0035BF8CE6
MIARLVEALRGLDPPPSVEELADALWLARHLPRDDRHAALAGTGAPAVPEDRSGEDDASGGSGPSRDAPAIANGHDPQRVAGGANGDGPPGARPVETPVPVPQAGLFLTGRNGGGAAAASYPVRSPAVPAVPRTLAISRALRPLRLRSRSPLPGRLDEVETARRYAETGSWEPVLRPATERRFELILVVDVSPSMALWRRTADELRLLLERLGVFRDVRVRYLDTGTGPLVLRAAPSPSAGTARTGNEPGGPAHRRILLVLSDCIGAAWQDGRAAALLDRWGRAGAVAIVQPLPQRLWWRCGAAVEPVRLAAPAPGAANARLAVRTRERGVPVPPGVAVPVMELEPRWLRPWAGMVAGAGHEIAGAALFTGRPVAEGAASATAADGAGVPVPSPAPEEDLSSPARVLRFRASASPAAFELAGYLAAAPLRLPVMRLVQRSMLPRSTPAHLAEVFLSGLLRVAGEGGGDPDEVAYDFQDGVRDVLLSALRRDEALGVLRAVWDTVRARMGSSLDFPALLAAVRTDTALPPLERPFAQVTAQVLARLGGRYTEIAERIAGSAVPGEQGREQPATAKDEPAGRQSGVPARDPAFTGRQALLDRIGTELRGGLTALLPEGGSTLGCVGKTHVAVEYAHAHVHDYAWTLWIPASDPVMARAALRRAAADMGLPPEDDPAALAGRVLDALRDGLPQGRWLLVYDDAGAPGDILRLMPPADALGSGGVGDVLVTSRHRAWARAGTGVVVGAFHRAESVSLLKAQVADLSDADADGLADLLGDLPPALRVAVGWLAEPGRDFGRFARSFDWISLPLRGGGPQSVPAPFATAVTMAFEDLGRDASSAMELLELWPFLSSGPVPARLLATSTTGRADVLADMRIIERSGLGRFDPASGTLQVSAEVRDMVAAQLPAESFDRSRDRVHALLAAGTPVTAPDGPSGWEARTWISSQVAPAQLVEGERTEVREVVIDQVRFLHLIGEHDGARRLGESALAEWRDRFGVRDGLVIELEHAVERRRAGGAAAPDPGGAELRLRGDFEGAYRLDSAEWRRMRQRYGDGDVSTLHAAAAVGRDLYLLGRFHEAHAVDMDSLGEVLRGDRPVPEQVLLARRRVARDLHALGRYEDARRLQRSALDEATAALGPAHPDVLGAHRLYAGMLRKAGETREAVRLADEAFDANAARLGESHPTTLAAAMTAALARTADGDAGAGRSLAEDALAGYRATAGNRHPFTHACAAGLGIVLRALGDVQEALEIDQAAHAALRDHPGPEHYYTLCCANGLANDLWLLGEPDAAYELSARTAEEFWTRLGPEHPYTLACAHNSERIRGADGERALAGLAAVLGDGHPDVRAAAAGEPLECDIELPSL